MTPLTPATIRVMIVDDSVVIRRLLTDALSAEPDIEIVATARNGLVAVAKLETMKVDVVILDIEMPELDGIGTVREIRKRDRHLPVIMFSTLSERGARITLDALAAGASDYVTKPANVGSVSASMAVVRSELAPRIRALTESQRPTRGVGASARAGAITPLRATSRPAVSSGAGAPPGVAVVAGPQRTSTVPPKVLLIGSSTGGPEALMKVVPLLPPTLGVPVLIVQHMPPVFTKLLAERLDRASELTVMEATDGQLLTPGEVYLAAGDRHLEIRAADAKHTKFATALTQAPPENFCRPAVDVLFRSVVRVYGAAVLSVVLTGMGSDGTAGARLIVAAGGHVIVQDQDSSVVWGMPGSIASHGLAHEVVPLNAISAAIKRCLAVSPAGAPRAVTRTAESVG